MYHTTIWTISFKHLAADILLFRDQITTSNTSNPIRNFVELEARTEPSSPIWTPRIVQIKRTWSSSAQINFQLPSLKHSASIIGALVGPY